MNTNTVKDLSHIAHSDHPSRKAGLPSRGATRVVGYPLHHEQHT